jgi:phosphoribosyl 1,2-cyclic phosphate phosphodiesterase
MSGEGALEYVILGCGSSGGVPRADGDWGVCDPSNPRNQRSRCAMMVRRRSPLGPDHETTVLIDTAPDLRLQTAAAGVRRVDAVLYTHDHADQANGMDDLRVFFLRHRRRTPCFMDAYTAASLANRFAYVFKDQPGYPAICEARTIPAFGEAFSIDGPSGPVPVTCFDQDHGDIRSVGYRIGDVAYSSDVVGLPEASFAALEGVRVWIVDALRHRPHPSHATVEMALKWIARVKPERAILTNMHIDLDFETLRQALPPGVEPAYDGLSFTVG